MTVFPPGFSGPFLLFRPAFSPLYLLYNLGNAIEPDRRRCIFFEKKLQL